MAGLRISKLFASHKARASKGGEDMPNIDQKKLIQAAIIVGAFGIFILSLTYVIPLLGISGSSRDHRSRHLRNLPLSYREIKTLVNTKWLLVEM